MNGQSRNRFPEITEKRNTGTHARGGKEEESRLYLVSTKRSKTKTSKFYFGKDLDGSFQKLFLVNKRNVLLCFDFFFKISSMLI